MEREAEQRLVALEQEVSRVTAKHPRVTPLSLLRAGASLADVVRKVNEIIARLQDTE